MVMPTRYSTFFTRAYENNKKFLPAVAITSNFTDQTLHPLREARRVTIPEIKLERPDN